MHDIVIRGGTVADGTGRPRFAGDIAIDGDRIAQVGGKAGAGRREIDAAGALVTPGWVDVHTHYDGQVTWDPYLTPSSWHGVTTVVMGNCGVGFAPVKRGVPDDSVATDDDVARMARQLRASLAAGALGFSTSRTQIHRGADGKLVPGTFAGRDELFGIGRALGEAGHGVFQMTSNHVDMPAETEWMHELARETGRPVLFNLQQIDQAPDLWKSLVARLDAAQAEGVPLIGSIPGRPAGVLYGWRASSHPFHFHPSWRALSHLPIEERIAGLRDPRVRASLLAEEAPIANPQAAFMLRSFDKMYRIDPAAPDYEPAPDQHAAAARGCRWRRSCAARPRTPRRCTDCATAACSRPA